MADEAKPKKKRKGLWWKLPLAGVGIIGVIIAAQGVNTYDTPKAIACDGSGSIDLLTKAFDNAQFARQASLTAVEISNVKEVSREENLLTCTATITTNSLSKLNIKYEFSNRNDRTFVKFNVISG